MHNRSPADLFARLPGHFRIRDAEVGDPLQALMGLLGDELKIIEQDLDQLYDNWFIETCEPWVLPYIADLVGARPMRDIGEEQAGLLRAYIANVLQYRQAKGTAAVVEQVARDVSGWAVVAVEFFQRLATSQHMNHTRAQAVVFPDIRNSGRVRHSRAPFSTMAHSAAAGAPEGWAGRYNIPHLGLFIWRQTAQPIWPVEDGAGYIGGAMPFHRAAEAGLFRFDPLGRDLPLLNRPAADLSVAARMTPRTVPAAIERAELGEALDAARDVGLSKDGWFETSPPFRIRLDGAEVAPAKIFGCDLSKSGAGEYRRPKTAGNVLVDPVLGRLSLHDDDAGKTIELGYATASSFDIGGGAYDRRESMARWSDAFTADKQDPPWTIGVTQIAGQITDEPTQGGPVVGTLSAAIEAWNAQATPGARGIIVVMDNATYDQAPGEDRTIALPQGAKLAITAAAWAKVDTGGGQSQRTPGEVFPIHRRPLIKGEIIVEAAESGQETGGTLILDGLVIQQPVALSPTGDLHHLGVYNCTLGAQGDRLDPAITCAAGNLSASVTLHRTIAGPIALGEMTGALSISRSIIGEDRTADGQLPAAPVLKAGRMDADISGSTLLGHASLRSIEAENSILLGQIALEHRQRGCVRFCFAPRGSALPRRYRCRPEEGDPATMRPVFVSTRFQDQGFGRLRMITPPEILEGAEDGMEMGVGFANREPARRANIIDAIAEFAPFGLASGLIFIDVGDMP
ncbi:hypothetical protein [Primorskyibacter sp. 2E233]|uniref:hypothetical protein n=1 Tax=Primorskyibacter sp. 2E233 TaxID=3413431 RepID=UPI003BF22559